MAQSEENSRQKNTMLAGQGSELSSSQYGGVELRMSTRELHSMTTHELNLCIHELVQKIVVQQPEATAIHAWDGQLRYEDLDTLSSSLAAHLRQRGVGPEVYVPVYSEKSFWVPTAMLAILKAGGAFVLLDPTNPVARLKELCQTVNARLIMASKTLAKTAETLALEVDVVVMTDELTRATPVFYTHGPDIRAQPTNVAYAVFTSGTSGKPKGVVIEHRATVPGRAAGRPPDIAPRLST